MTIRTTLIASSLIAASLVSGAAHAVLQGRDLNGSVSSAEAYYDTDLDITWLANANYAQTSGYDADGRMTWAAANTWAAQLDINGYADWRLPTVSPVNGVSFNYPNSFNGSTDRGYNISEQGTAFAGATGSEMAHLFYNTLNNKAYCPVSTNCSTAQAGWGLTNTGPFTNLYADFYWSAPEYAPNTGYAWHFYMLTGAQYSDFKTLGYYALAVSTGDVGIAAVAVPEADTWAMLLAGLGLVGMATRRRRG